MFAEKLIVARRCAPDSEHLLMFFQGLKSESHGVSVSNSSHSTNLKCARSCVASCAHRASRSCRGHGKGVRDRTWPPKPGRSRKTCDKTVVLSKLTEIISSAFSDWPASRESS